MSLRFEWDFRKALINLSKHGVSFEEARTIFGDPLSLTVADREHAEGEFRFAIVGRTTAGRLVVVSHVERGDTIRLISARPADRREKKAYEEGQNDRAGA
jgi:uncharacterized DUF497 family protein